MAERYQNLTIPFVDTGKRGICECQWFPKYTKQMEAPIVLGKSNTKPSLATIGELMVTCLFINVGTLDFGWTAKGRIVLVLSLQKISNKLNDLSPNNLK